MAKVIVLYTNPEWGDVPYDGIVGMAVELNGALKLVGTDGSGHYIAHGHWVTADMHREGDE